MKGNYRKDKHKETKKQWTQREWHYLADIVNIIVEPISHKCVFLILFLLGFGIGQITSLQFIRWHVQLLDFIGQPSSKSILPFAGL